MAQAGAIAAIRDQKYLTKVLDKVAASKKRIYKIAEKNGLKPIQSATNFVAIDCGRDGTYARAIVDGLLQHGIFIRMPGVAPLNRCIRVSCGNKKDLDQLAKALPLVLKQLC